MSTFARSHSIALNPIPHGTALEAEWKEEGPDVDPRLLVRACWYIDGIGFHAEAIRVTRDEDGIQQIDPHGLSADHHYCRNIRRAFEAFNENIGPNGGFQTIKMFDADYALFIYPFSK